MKKVVFCLMALVLCLGVTANETGHFFVDLSAKHVSLSDVTSSFGSYTTITEGSTFELFRDTTDAWGVQHLSFQQYYKGLKVQNHMILVHAKDGLVSFIHGHVMTEAPSQSPAHQRISANKKHSDGSMLFLHNGKYYHVYRVPSRERLEMQYIDVETGEVIYTESAFRYEDVTVQAETRYYGEQDMTVNHRDGKYFLEDEGRNMVTLSGRGKEVTDYYTSDEYLNSLPDDVQAVLQNPALDVNLFNEYWNRYLIGPMAQDFIDNRAVSLYSETADIDLSPLDPDYPREYCDIHWGMQKTIDFFRETFNRNSFDGHGYPIYNVAFPPTHPLLFAKMPVNAAAQCVYEPFFMMYGEGDGITLNPIVGLDVMAHEFTHMVTARNGNGDLVYQTESGALNESFSDCMAMGVMQYTFGSCRWTIGDEATIEWPNLRNMADPNNSRGAAGDSASRAQPDTYKGKCWWNISNPTPDNDQGGVHINSGVQNYWFYLLCEGGADTNDNGDAFDVTAIGMDKALQIVYRNLIFYLTPLATYEDARQGALCAATDLYGFESPEYISVMNAWYAVGVGEPFGGMTGLSNADKPLPTPTKRLKDGHVLIQRGEKLYTITGQEVN